LEKTVKVKKRNSNIKANKMSGFRTRMKTSNGRNIVRRKRRKSGTFRVG